MDRPVSKQLVPVRMKTISGRESSNCVQRGEPKFFEPLVCIGNCLKRLPFMRFERLTSSNGSNRFACN
jgi:hypothetical protein